jgi:EAL domain-containing protein (putative c-di-GMP-specific phosphodiesterase class I)
MGGLEGTAVASDARSRQDGAVRDVSYDWNLLTDRIDWGSNLANVIEFAGEQAFATGLAYAEHLAPVSPSSRYEAIMAGGFDTGSGVPFRVIYGLLPYGRSPAPPVWVEDSGRWFADGNGRPVRASGAVRVVTEQYEAERARTSAAQRDPETGAFNQAHFEDQVARHLELSTRKHTTFAVVLVEFSIIGGGNQAGDAAVMQEVMGQAVARITRQMRAGEILARHGKTGLAILFENCNGDQLEIAAARLLGFAGATPMSSAIGPVNASFRAGGVVAPLQGRTVRDVLSFAAEALAIARQQGGAGFVRYELEAARKAANGRLLKATDMIVSALNEGRVMIALQPVVDAKTRKVAFYEALVRIRSLDGTLIMPDVLVPAAEQGGLVALLDRRVADLSLAHLNANRHLELSVNASVISLHNQEWQQHFRAACRRYPDAARRLTIEITETCAIADLEATRSVLETLKGLGIKIAIDDFGAGHSSFRNLRGLPIDYLKIDGAFAQNFGRSSDDEFFVRTLIDLARNLRIPAVAEWVEDEATAQILTGWGVDYLQGHLFGKAEVAGEEAPLAAVV